MVKLPGYKVKKEVISPEGAPHKTLDLTLVTESNDKSIADITSKPSVTTEQATQADSKSEVVTEPSVTEGQATQAPSKDSAVVEPAATTGQESQSVVKQEAH
jgi:hypothetical protein